MSTECNGEFWQLSPVLFGIPKIPKQFLFKKINMLTSSGSRRDLPLLRVSPAVNTLSPSYSTTRGQGLLRWGCEGSLCRLTLRSSSSHGGLVQCVACEWEVSSALCLLQRIVPLVHSLLISETEMLKLPCYCGQFYCLFVRAQRTYHKSMSNLLNPPPLHPPESAAQPTLLSPSHPPPTAEREITSLMLCTLLHKKFKKNHLVVNTAHILKIFVFNDYLLPSLLPPSLVPRLHFLAPFPWI